MKLSELKENLKRTGSLNFIRPDGIPVPSHFHITEAGLITKHFIDCGGTVRKEEVVNFQLWSADDLEHRLQPEKFLSIIRLSEKELGLGDQEVEVEYQSGTIGRYGLAFDGKNFHLTNKLTDCLAKDSCGTSAPKQKLSLKSLQPESSNCCDPTSGCCN